MKKWWVKLLLFAAIVLVSVVSWVSISGVHSKSAVERYKDQLRAAGEKLTIEELTPPRTNPDSNGVLIFEEAVTNLHLDGTVLSYNPPYPMVMVAAGKAMIRWQQPDILNNDSTGSWEKATSALQINSRGIELLQQAAERPRFDFELDYKHGLLMQLPHLSDLDQAASMLRMAAVVQLHEGDTAGAVTNIHTILAMVNAWQDEPVAISQMFRIIMAQAAVSAQWELLQATNVTESQLATLQRDWTILQFDRPMEIAFLTERLMASATIEQLRETNDLSRAIGFTSALSGGRSSGNLLDDLNNIGRSIRHRTSVDLWQLNWSYEDELQDWQFNQISVEALRQARTNGFFKDALAEWGRKYKILDLGRSNHHWLRNQFPAGLTIYGPSSNLQTWQRLLPMEAARQMAITSIALKRYELRHGVLPQDLNSLVPEFLSVLPRDPVDGHPLRYGAKADGTFLLYSIGEDAVDDGGDPTSRSATKSFYWQHGRDWVWAQPATPQEVQHFRANPPN
jgi:hypothetical protein